MLKPLSKAAHVGYTRGVKLVIFKFDADDIHAGMISMTSLVQKAAPIRGVVRASMHYTHPMLHTNVLGIEFKNPLGLSAGIDKNVQIYPMLEAMGFGFAECGSTTYGSYEGNPQPWYVRLPKSKSIIVNSGLRNEGAEAIIKRVSGYSPKLLARFPLNISIAKTNSPKNCTQTEGVRDYVESLKLWEKAGLARMYTLNISCPNTFGGEPFTTPAAIKELLTEVDKLEIKRPIFVKMPIDKTIQESNALLKEIAKHNVQGITLGNLYKDRKTVKLEEEFDPNIKGNFSGKPCWEASNELLARAYAEYGDRFVFSGVGGVFTAEDAYHKIRLGASLVEIATGLIFGGPAVVGQINMGLVKLLQKDGFKSVSEAVGVDVKKKKHRPRET